MKKHKTTKGITLTNSQEETATKEQPTQFDYESEVTRQLKTCVVKLSFLEWSIIQRDIRAIAHIAETILIKLQEINPVKCTALAINLYFIKIGKLVVKEKEEANSPAPLPVSAPVFEPPVNPDFSRVTCAAGSGITIHGGKFHPFQAFDKHNKEN